MNKIQKFIKSKEQNNFVFKPQRDFYEKINIRQKRFGQILRDEASPTLTEIEAIANYFNISINELINL